jgi:hypothetical protein
VQSLGQASNGMLVHARLEDGAQRLLVTNGLTLEASPENALRESAILAALLLDLTRRGPDRTEPAIADGVLGFRMMLISELAVLRRMALRLRERARLRRGELRTHCGNGYAVLEPACSRALSRFTRQYPIERP